MPLFRKPRPAIPLISVSHLPVSLSIVNSISGIFFLLKFDSDFDSFSDALFNECAAETLRHFAGGRLVIVRLQTLDKIASQTIIQVHIVNDGDVAFRGFLKTDVAQKVMDFHDVTTNDNIGAAVIAFIPALQQKVCALR